MDLQLDTSEEGPYPASENVVEEVDCVSFQDFEFRIRRKGMGGVTYGYSENNAYFDVEGQFYWVLSHLLVTDAKDRIEKRVIFKWTAPAK